MLTIVDRLPQRVDGSKWPYCRIVAVVQKRQAIFPRTYTYFNFKTMTHKHTDDFK